MLLSFFTAKKEHKKFIKEIPYMDDENLLIAYDVLDDDIYYGTGNKYTKKELRKVYYELKKRGYTDCTGQVLKYKIQITNIA